MRRTNKQNQRHAIVGMKTGKFNVRSTFFFLFCFFFSFFDLVTSSFLVLAFKLILFFIFILFSIKD